MAVRLKDEAALKAASATKIATARTINGTSFDGSANITTSNWGTARTITIGNSGKSVNGSGNISWSLSEIGAVGLASPAFTGTPTAPTAAAGTNSTQLATTAFVTTAINNKTSVSGNAGTATTLQTARTINGTSFNGSANITTANWGTSRTLTVGNTGKSVNGSANVSWSLAEIGALPLTGGTMTGNIVFNGGNNIKKANTTGSIDVCSGTAYNDSPALSLYANGYSDTSIAGDFRLRAGSNAHVLIGKSSGSLKWSGKEVLRDGLNNFTMEGGCYIHGLSAAAYEGIEILTGGAGTWSTGGAGIVLASKDATTRPGWFMLRAGNGTAYVDLLGKPDGTLTWNGSNVITAKGGTMTGDLQMGNRVVKFTTDNSGYARIGYETSTEDVFISSAANQWLRLKKDGSMTWKGQNVITSAGGTITGTITVNNSSSGISGTLWSGTGGFVVQGEAGANLHLGSNNQSNDIVIYTDNKIQFNKHLYTNSTIYLGNGKARLGSNVFSLVNVTDTYTNIYLGPADGGEARVCAWGNVDSGYRPIRAFSFINAEGSVFSGNILTMQSNGCLSALEGHVVFRSESNKEVYLQGSKTVVCAPKTTNTYRPILASAFTVSSQSKHKEEITLIDEDKSVDTMEILKSTNVYTYKLTDELENGIDKKKIGLIVEQATADLVNDEEEGIELYQMASTLWDVCKKQQETIEKQQEAIDKQQQAIEQLQQEVSELKAS